MTKGKAKINGNEDTAPAQTRSLRSRRRASCSAEESSQTHHVQAAPLRKNTERDMKASEITLLQSNLQEGAEVTNIHHEGDEQSSLSKPDDSNFENNSEETDTTGMGNKAEGETTVRDPDHCFELESCGEQADDCPHGKETGSKESRRSPSQPQMFVPTSEDDRESCHAVLEKQVVEKERSNSKRNQDTNNDEPSCCLSDIKDPAVGLPAKKKRRMGMCGLTEKERSHFLQAQQRDAAQNGAERSEKQALEEDVAPSQSTPPHITAEVIEEREEETQPAHSGYDHRAETEAHDVVTGSDGTSNQGCLEDSMADPEPNGNTETIEAAKEEEEKHLENLQPPEVKEPTSGKAEEDFSLKVQTNRLNETHAMEREESDAEAPRPERRCMNGGKPEMTDVICGDGDEEGASHRGTEGFSCVSENLCKGPLTSTVQETKNSCDPNADPAAGPSTVSTEHAPTRDLGGSLGTGCLDYVSDSQLNTIVLTEEREEEPEPSGDVEDATELICGLIRELSSLNRKVMVAHRELENMRRKPSRSSVR